MKKFAFAAVAALALATATSAFADEVVQTGHGAAVLVRSNQSTLAAGDLAGINQDIDYGRAHVSFGTGPGVASNNGAQLVRNETVPAETVISFGPARYTVG